MPPLRQPLRFFSRLRCLPPLPLDTRYAIRHVSPAYRRRRRHYYDDALSDAYYAIYAIYDAAIALRHVLRYFTLILRAARRRRYARYDTPCHAMPSFSAVDATIIVAIACAP